MNIYRTAPGPKGNPLAANKAQDHTSPSPDDWFEGIFNLYWRKISGLLYRLVGDPAEAEDLALEVFWRLHRRPPVFDDHHKLNGWLYRVATNLGFNALRARKRRQAHEEEAGYQEMVSNSPDDPALLSEREETRQRVRQTLGRMKPRAARLLVLRYSGLSYAELAAATRVAPSSVGALLARAEREFENRYAESEKSP
jgi:RNA polymerase sigma-70 factor (ECF subfamily)